MPCAPSIPGKAASLGYEEGPRGELLRIAGAKGYSGMHGDGPGPSDYRAEPVKVNPRTLNFGKGAPRPSLPGSRKGEADVDKGAAVRRSKQAALKASGDHGQTVAEVAAQLSKEAGLPPQPGPTGGSDVALAAGGGGFGNGGGTLRLAVGDWRAAGEVAADIAARDPTNPFGQAQPAYHRFGASPTKPSPMFMPPTSAPGGGGNARSPARKEERPGPGAYDTATTTLKVAPTPPEALQFFSSTVDRFQSGSGSALGGSGRTVAAPQPGPGAYEANPSSFARAAEGGQRARAREARLAMRTGSAGLGSCDLGFDSSGAADRSAALLAGRGSTADVGPGQYDARGFAEEVVRRAKGPTVGPLAELGLQVSNGDFLSSGPRFPERSWEAARGRRPGPATYFQANGGGGYEGQQPGGGGAGGLPVGPMVSISAAAAAQRPLPHAANAAALGWRPKTTGSLSAGGEPAALLPGGVAGGRTAHLESERSRNDASTAGSVTFTAGRRPPSTGSTRSRPNASSAGTGAGTGAGTAPTNRSRSPESGGDGAAGGSSEAPLGPHGLEAALGAAARAAALMEQRDRGLLHGSIPMGTRGVIGHSGDRPSSGVVSTKGPAPPGLMRGTVRRPTSPEVALGGGGGESLAQPLSFTSSFKATSREGGAWDRDPSDLRRLRAAAGGGQLGHHVDATDRVAPPHADSLPLGTGTGGTVTGNRGGIGPVASVFAKPLTATDLAPAFTSSAALALAQPDRYSLQQGASPLVRGPALEHAPPRWQPPVARKADEASRVGPGSYSAPSLLGAQGGSLGLVRRSARGVMDSASARVDDSAFGGRGRDQKPGPGAYDPIKPEGNLLAKTHNVAILAQSALTA